MPRVPAYEFGGAQADPVTLPDAWFAERVSEGALWQTVRAYEANQRQGTSATLTRSVVSGAKSKPWRQKGTGRARAGTRTSPLWSGGGVVFGPHPRDHRQKLPKRVRRLALRSALRQKLDEEAVFVVRLDAFDKPSTARLSRALAAITEGRRVLLLTARFDENLFLSGRNIGRLTMKQLKDVTAYEVLRASVVLIEADALEGDPLPGLHDGADDVDAETGSGVEPREEG
ncbi:MAG: 50S ribosomal protein L4 [Gemmatimonadota bacterium]